MGELTRDRAKILVDFLMLLGQTNSQCNLLTIFSPWIEATSATVGIPGKGKGYCISTFIVSEHVCVCVFEGGWDTVCVCESAAYVWICLWVYVYISVCVYVCECVVICKYV